MHQKYPDFVFWKYSKLSKIIITFYHYYYHEYCSSILFFKYFLTHFFYTNVLKEFSTVKFQLLHFIVRYLNFCTNGISLSSLMKIKLRSLENENETIGILLSSKAIVQLFMNPLVGVLTAYVGYNLPIFLGSILLIIVSVCKYNVLFYEFFLMFALIL